MMCGVEERRGEERRRERLDISYNYLSSTNTYSVAQPTPTQLNSTQLTKSQIHKQDPYK